MSPGTTTHGSVDRCVACSGPLVHDQNYCLRCGTRRGPLPAPIAAVVGELAGRRAAVLPAAPVPAGATIADDDPGDDGRDRLGELIPLARAAAISILLMLGVGSVIGAATSQGGVTSLAKTIVVAFHPASPPATTELASTAGSGEGRGGGEGGGGGAGGGGSGTSGGGGSGGGGGAAAAPATVTQRTVTVSQTTTPSSGDRNRGTTSSTTPTSTTASTLPPIGHVWEIVLSGQGYGQSFGTTKGHPYLSKTLVDQGEVISQYDAVAASPLANEIALISGQGPTPQTLADCPQYSDIVPAQTGRLGQVLGAGCLYPAATETLGLQMQIAGLKWRAYVQGVGDPGQTTPPTTTGTTPPTATGTPTTTATVGPTSTSTSTSASTSPSTSGTTSAATTTTAATTTAAATVTTAATTTAAATVTTAATTTAAATVTTAATTTSAATVTAVPDTSAAADCPHPAEGAIDPAQATRASDGYVTWKNPWVYFHATVDSASCARDDVGLQQLTKNLRMEKTTPAFSYISADPCDDGSDTPCRAGAKGGLARADAFLKTVVPEIERSPAYRHNGLILITFDEAPQSGPEWSTASCCGEPTYPNLPDLTTTAAIVPTTTTAGTTAGATTTSCPTTTATATTTTTTTTTTETTGTGTTTPAACQPAITGDPPGGGQVGLLMISPYIKPHTVNTIETYNHYSLLKSIENLFGLSHLGYTADKQVPAFIPSLFSSTKR
jgi:hypothetical protein